MKIIKLYNNNVVMAIDSKKNEVVVMGNGLGFKTSVGDNIDERKIEKTFILKDYDSKLSELINDIPMVYLEITEEIVKYAKSKFNMQLNKNIYLQLTDHLYFAIERLKQNISIENPFVFDIKQYYMEEYNVALTAKRIIRNRLNFEINDEEVGYIAMHIFEASNDSNRKDFQRVNQLMKEVIEFIQEHLDLSRNEKTLEYNRLKIHVNYFAKRYIKNNESKNTDKIMDDTIKNTFIEESNCVRQLSNYLAKKYGRVMTDAEKNYLTLHLRNCRN